MAVAASLQAHHVSRELVYGDILSGRFGAEEDLFTAFTWKRPVELDFSSRSPEAPTGSLGVLQVSLTLPDLRRDRDLRDEARRWLLRVFRGALSFPLTLSFLKVASKSSSKATGERARFLVFSSGSEVRVS
ncbi:hypothetical protein MRX96_058184 [Rhipicephalus microplus]